MMKVSAMVPEIPLIWLALFCQLSLQWPSNSTTSSPVPITSSSYRPHLPTTSPCEESETQSIPSSSKSQGIPWSSSTLSSSSPSHSSESSAPCETTSTASTASTPQYSYPSPSSSHVTRPSATPSSSTPCEETSSTPKHSKSTYSKLTLLSSSPYSHPTSSQPSYSVPSSSSSSPSYSSTSSSSSLPSYRAPSSSSSKTIPTPPSSSSTPGCPTLSITEYRTVYITTQFIEIDTISEPPVTITSVESSVCFTRISSITKYETVVITTTLPGSISTSTSVSIVTTFACQAGTTYVTNYNYGNFTTTVEYCNNTTIPSQISGIFSTKTVTQDCTTPICIPTLSTSGSVSSTTIYSCLTSSSSLSGSSSSSANPCGTCTLCPSVSNSSSSISTSSISTSSISTSSISTSSISTSSISTSSISTPITTSCPTIPATTVFTNYTTTQTICGSGPSCTPQPVSPSPSPVCKHCGDKWYILFIIFLILFILTLLFLIGLAYWHWRLRRHCRCTVCSFMAYECICAGGPTLPGPGAPVPAPVPPQPAPPANTYGQQPPAPADGGGGSYGQAQ